MNFISCSLITAESLQKYSAVSELIQGVRRLVFYGNFFRQDFFHYLGDWALELSTFLGTKSHSPKGSCDFMGPKKVLSSRAQSPS